MCGSPRMSPLHTFSSLSMCQHTLEGALVPRSGGRSPVGPCLLEICRPSSGRKIFLAFPRRTREKGPPVRALKTLTRARARLGDERGTYPVKEYLRHLRV